MARVSLVLALAFALAATSAEGLPGATGQKCDFENSTNPGCGWEWKQTEHGFRVVTGQEIASLQQNVKGLSGPTMDASNNTQGHFLFLNVQPNSSEPLHLTSPLYTFHNGVCKLQLSLHTANVSVNATGPAVPGAPANSSIAVFAESPQGNGSYVRWVLKQNVSNTENAWQQHTIFIGRVLQNIRIVIEIANNSRRTGHVAIDNLQLVKCFHGTRLKTGEQCAAVDHYQCPSAAAGDAEQCLSRSHVCDLVKDCPGGEDEADEQSCQRLPYGARCDFQDGMCGWNASAPHRTVQWKRLNGSTPGYKGAKDHTYGNDTGMYLYVDTTSGELGQEALLDSVVFNPPPPCHRNETSKKCFKSCELRFFYHQYGQHGGSLAVAVHEFFPKNKRKQYQLFWKYGDKKSTWTQVLIALPALKYKYQIHMEARRGMRAADMAVDDITLSPECFGKRLPPEELGDYDYDKPEPPEPVEPDMHRDFINKTMYVFTSCGAKGMFGPTQASCAATYNGTTTNVTVLSDAPYAGVQRWVVPETEVYTIIARGASGGSGSEGQGWSLAAESRIVLDLNSGDVLYILVGQEGTSTCRKGDDSNGECRSFFNAPADPRDVRKQLMYGVDNTTGGGGGGGGSFVFRRVKSGGRAMQPLVVAAGGGGLGNVGQDRHRVDDERQHGHGVNESRPATAGVGIGDRPAGPGGGWLASNVSERAGLSLLQGAQGGRGCKNSSSGKGDGGFGGGGGGCAAGGGGGGYSGGNAWTERYQHGEGGYSAVLEGTLRQATPGVHEGGGAVFIIPGLAGCDCAYRCAALNEKRSRVECVCPPEWRVNGNLCKPEGASIYHYIIPVLVGALVVMVIMMCGCALYTYNKFQRRKELHLRRKGPTGADLQLRNLRNDLMTETNPNYEFAGERYTLRDLREVPREHLRLLRALGQGAFGEVYEGLYKMRPGDAVEMPVAVKTLPELSTLQAENDFMLEALIMGKFNHPNIVHLIGVCFDKHPRYIVLELLSGGDLKTFLRESRPRPDRPGTLCMKDLLMCCVDVAKGCKYLEENRFIHRDIAARNCLLTAKTPGRIVKIADFGMAREVYMSDYYRKGGKAMLPIKWMPPEAFLDGIFTVKTDVWSYGVLLWEVMSLGYMPYTGCANRNVMSLVVSGGRLEPPPNCPQPVYSIMTSCWHPEPQKRPVFATILEKLLECLQDPEILSTPLRPMIGLSESGLQVRYNHDFEAMAKSIALVHGWLEDSKVCSTDPDAMPPTLSVAPSASSDSTDITSAVGLTVAELDRLEKLERSADYLVPMHTVHTAPAGNVSPGLPPAPPPPHRPPPGPAPGDVWMPGHTPTRSRSKQPLLQGDSSSSSLGSLLGIDKAMLTGIPQQPQQPQQRNGPLANGKDAKDGKGANPLTLDPSLLGKTFGVGVGKYRTDGDGAPAPSSLPVDTEISC